MPTHSEGAARRFAVASPTKSTTHTRRPAAPTQAAPNGVFWLNRPLGLRGGPRTQPKTGRELRISRCAWARNRLRSPHTRRDMRSEFLLGPELDLSASQWPCISSPARSSTSQRHSLNRNEAGGFEPDGGCSEIQNPAPNGDIRERKPGCP